MHEDIKMKLQNYTFECAPCGCSFKSPDLLDGSYGEFILRSKTGEMAYLYSPDCQVFNEFSDMLAQHPWIANMNLSDKAKVLHQFFGWACDLAPDGTAYSINQRPICPQCGACNFKHWGPTIPFEDVNMDPPSLSYNKWRAMTQENKKHLINQAVSSYFQ